MKRRLFWQIYITIIASLVLVVASAGLMWRAAQRTSPAQSAFDFAGELATAVLPDASVDTPGQQAALEKFGAALHTDLALFGADRKQIAAAGRPLPAPEDWQETGGWMHAPGGHAWAIGLPDGRWLVMRAPRRAPPRHPALGLIGFLGTIALGVAICAYPVVRGLTRRLEQLDEGVVALGTGDLSARVKVEGRDEIAALAQNFNRSAERIEALVASNRMLLANASHELRTPLSRIRLGVEFLKQGPDAKREAALERDIAELDELIDEILLSSRLETIETLDRREAVDLLGLSAEECARYPECTLNGSAVTVSGDPQLLRRLIRNLIDNAMRHGSPPVEVTLTSDNGTATLTVADHGTGIPDKDRETIFEPFRRGTVRASGGGTGLGLTLVRSIARRHGGEAIYEITNASASAPVSAFRVTLPC